MRKSLFDASDGRVEDDLDLSLARSLVFFFCIGLFKKNVKATRGSIGIRSLPRQTPILREKQRVLLSLR